MEKEKLYSLQTKKNTFNIITERKRKYINKSKIIATGPDEIHYQFLKKSTRNISFSTPRYL